MAFMGRESFIVLTRLYIPSKISGGGSLTWKIYYEKPSRLKNNSLLISLFNQVYTRKIIDTYTNGR